MAKILVIRLAAIADVAMTLPVIYSAAKANPKDSFTVLTQAFMMPVFMNRPSNVEVIGISTKGAEKTLIGLLRFTSALVKFDFDIVLDLQNVIRTMIIRTSFWMKGKPVYVLDKIRKRYPPLMRMYSVLPGWLIPNLSPLYTNHIRPTCQKWRLLLGSRQVSGWESLLLPVIGVKFIRSMKWSRLLLHYLKEKI